MEFVKAFDLIVLSLTAWSAVALLLDRRGYARANRWFAALLFCLCIPQVYFYSRLVQPPEGVFWLALLAQSTLWLKGPVLFVMVNLALNHSLSRPAWHLLPFAIVVPGLLLKPEWVFEWGLAGFCHVMVYLALCWQRLLTNKTRLRTIFYGYQNSAWFWILCVVLGMTVLMTLDASLMLLAYVQRSFLPSAFMAINWTISFYLLTLAFFSIYRPELFFHQLQPEEEPVSSTVLPSEKSKAQSDDNNRAPTLTLVSRASQVKNWRELNESLAMELAGKLNQLMRDEELYRQNELSLSDLAMRLSISVHQASELLNVHFSENFYDYINRYRLAYACQLLLDKQCHLRILDIAFESGFSNKNSFYRYFRETYNMTPIEFRDRKLAKAVVR